MAVEEEMVVLAIAEVTVVVIIIITPSGMTTVLYVPLTWPSHYRRIGVW